MPNCCSCMACGIHIGLVAYVFSTNGSTQTCSLSNAVVSCRTHITCQQRSSRQRVGARQRSVTLQAFHPSASLQMSTAAPSAPTQMGQGSLPQQALKHSSQCAPMHTPIPQMMPPAPSHAPQEATTPSLTAHHPEGWADRLTLPRDGAVERLKQATSCF